MPTRSSPMLQSYSEFLASSFGNFTQTYFADHSETQNGSSPTIFLKLLPPQPESRRRGSGFKDDSIKINVEQIFKLMSPYTEVKKI